MTNYIRAVVLVFFGLFTHNIFAQVVAAGPDGLCFVTNDLMLGSTGPTVPSTGPVPSTGQIPLERVARFYVKNTNKYFFTAAPREELGELWCVDNSVYKLEGYGERVGIFSVSKSPFLHGAPVYRFRNSQNGDYFYTISDAERFFVLGNMPQYLYEGVAWYAATSQIGNSTPVYRFSTPSGGHLYTKSEAERASITANYPGFVLEGIAFWAW